MMKKYFFLVMALLMSASFAFAVDLSNPNLLEQGFDDDNGGTGATFDKTSQTITFNGAWSSMRWTLWGDTDPDQLVANYQSFTIEIEPVDFWTEVNITDWRDGADHTPMHVGIPAGERTATVDITNTANQIVFEGEEGTVKIVAAYLTPKGDVVAPSNLDLLAKPFEDHDAKGATWDETLQILTFNGAWSGRDWTFWGKEDQMAADYQSFTIVIEPVDFYTQVDINDYSGGTDFTQKAGINAGDATVTVDMGPASMITFQGGDGATSVKILAAYLTPKATGIPQIKAPASQVYGATNGIVVNAANEKVSIYGIDGRLVKQAIANNQTIDMAKGLYIVKVGDEKAVKVVVK